MLFRSSLTCKSSNGVENGEFSHQGGCGHGPSGGQIFKPNIAAVPPMHNVSKATIAIKIVFRDFFMSSPPVITHNLNALLMISFCKILVIVYKKYE